MSSPVFLGEFTELPRPEEIIRILRSEAKHISVCRLKADTEILLANGVDKVARARLMYVDSREVHVRVVATEERPRLRPHATVVQALPESDRAELAVDSMTEAGVDEIIPWAVVNCVARWQGTAKVIKVHAKWQSAVREAAKQVRRAWIPPIVDLHGSADIEQLIRETASAGGVATVLHEEETAPFVELAAQVANTDKVLFIVGPEGGVSSGELEAFRAAGTSSVVLGPTVLRSVLAGAAALCALGPLTKRWGGVPTRGQ